VVAASILVIGMAFCSSAAAQTAHFSFIYGVAVDGSGNVFVSDNGSGAVNKIMTSGVNFGSAVVATMTPATIPLTFTFDTAGTIKAPAVLKQGAANLDFKGTGNGTCTTNGTSHDYAIGDTCTVIVTFTPKYAGLRYGAVELLNSSGTVIATANVYGTSVGPQAVFSPSMQSTLGSGFSNPNAVTVDGSGNVYVADYTNHAVKEMPAGRVSSSCVTTLGSGFSGPYGVAVDGSGSMSPI
jgi:hypothetical protein